MLMYSVVFYNFGFMKHFDVLEEAMTYAKESGFECAVVGPDNEVIKKVSVI